MMLRVFLLTSLILIVIGGGGIWFLQAFPPQEKSVQEVATREPAVVPESGSGSEMPPLLRSRPTDYSAIGTITFDSDTPFLLLRGQRLELVFDGLTVCASATGGLPCVMMSVMLSDALDGKTASVEGESQNGSILVRKIQTVENIAAASVPQTGNIYVVWVEARRMLLACEVTMAVQNHSAEVMLTLVSGERVKTVEPVIDEIFRVFDEGARANCPTLAIATE